MSVAKELSGFAPAKDSILTIGVFDGVHLGHKHLLAELTAQAAQRHLLAGVVTFRQHPEDVLFPTKKLPFLTDIETRIRLLKAEGVDFIVPLSFTPELARLDPRTFLTYLQQYLRMRGLVIGADFALGRQREGDIPALKRLGEEMGFSVTVVPPLKINGEVVSSTAIRQAMASGDMPKVHVLTGRYFSLQGKVVGGSGRGKSLGFPTANLDISSGQALPPDGVYAGLARINGKAYPSLTNIGMNPTFGNMRRTVETYIIDYGGDLYGRELSVDLVARLREEIKFKDAGQLKKQLAEDVVRGRAVLQSMGINQP